MNEFAISWVKGADYAEVSAPSGSALKSKILSLAEKNPDEVTNMVAICTSKLIFRGGKTVREILFKAKRKDNGEWIEGGYFSEPYTDKKYIICWNSFGFGFNEFIEVDPDTLCQFTGLTDKNGKRIWENDICDTFENDSKEMLRNVVKFEDGCFKVFKKHYLSMHLDYYEESDLKVVGNIFDNADLLEVE